MTDSPTLVIQSHRQPLPAPWYEPCIESVQAWARHWQFEYRWLGDELFAGIDAMILAKTRERLLVATDLGRLLVLEAALQEGFERVVWVDADVLIVQPERLDLQDSSALFGREVWVQASDSGRLKVYRKIHNAFMAFAAGDPVLPFYRYAAERILQRYQRGPSSHSGGMVAELIGPKLLTLLHNAIGFDVIEGAGMLSPLVCRDLLRDRKRSSDGNRGAALDLFLRKSQVPPCAVNLGGSSVATGKLDDEQMMAVVTELLRDPGLLGLA
jgi:hypothetical protein